MAKLQRIQPCLWFDRNGEEAARFYTSVFPHSSIGAITHYSDEGHEFHHMPSGHALTVSFQLDGMDFLALNGGPSFRFNEAVSLVVHCDTQQEIDHYWSRLGEGGDPAAQQCGWLKDRFGLSWQIVPEPWMRLLVSGEQTGIDRGMRAMFAMKKLDLAELLAAYEGR